LPTYIKWPAPVGVVRLEYAPEILERLRLLAIDGLLSLPRVGMAIGGLLTGSFEQGRVRVTDAVEIPCSHAISPGFLLTTAELARASAMAFGEERRQVVGWYCSKTRGELAIDEQQTKMFRELCPEPWQIGLIIKPSTVEPTRAALCSRAGAQSFTVGQPMDLVEYVPMVRALPMEEVAASEVLPSEEKPASEPIPAAVPIMVPQFVETSVEAKREASPVFHPVTPPPPPPQPIPQRIPFDRYFELDTSPTARPIRLYVLLSLVLVTLLAFLYSNRFWFVSRPPLQIRLSVVGDQIDVHWNPEALEGLDEGTVTLNDGGQLQTITLDRRLLESGWVRAPRKSDRVIAKLTAGDVTGLSTWTPPDPPRPGSVSRDQDTSAAPTAAPAAASPQPAR
jgi:hypothetical protein